jgi:CBS/transporter associated domain-containing protein
MSEHTNAITQIIIILILTTINALFAAAELAIVSSKNTKIKILAEKGNKNAILFQKLLKEPTKFLSSIQVAITFAGFLSSASAATSLSTYITDFLNMLKIPYAAQTSVIIITILLSIFILLFGELIPKRIAMVNPEKIALALIPMVNFIYIIFRPIVVILSFTTNLILKLLGISRTLTEQQVSEEEIKANIYMGTKQGLLEDEDSKMIMSIFDFDDEIVSKIMVPRNETYMININDLDKETLKETVSVGYSRIPVYEDREDNVIGMLYIKDLLKYSLEDMEFPLEKVREILRKPFIVPESKKINKLLKEMQKTKKHIAIVTDEFGGVIGIATIEDIIEEIVGDINDEYDDEHDIPKLDKKNENIFMIDRERDTRSNK